MKCKVFTLAFDLEGDGVSGKHGFAYGLGEFLFGGDEDVVDLDDVVAALESGLGRGAGRGYVVDGDQGGGGCW